MKVTFDEILAKELTTEEIEKVTIDGDRPAGYDYTWTLEINEERTSYIIRLEFDHEDIPKDTKFTLQLNEEVTDVPGN